MISVKICLWKPALNQVFTVFSSQASTCMMREREAIGYDWLHNIDASMVS